MTLNRMVGVSLGCLLFAGAALAQGATGQGAAKPADPKAKVVITNPEWEVKPDEIGMGFFYPADAAKKHIKGDATIRCKVSLSHLLRDCEVVSETPPDAGFGRAAIAWSSVFRLKPMTRNGVPVDGAAVDIPIHFDCGTCSVSDLGRYAGITANTIYFSLPWSRTPTYEEWLAAYPAGARRNPVLGSVAMQCEFADGGRLTQCDVKTESPEGRGFGTAARALSKAFIGPASSDGKSTKGSSVRLNIAFPPELATGGRPALPETKLLIAPTDQQIAAVFPPAARERNIPFGKASIQCARDGAGRASGCTVVSESPAGAGFGQAAMALAPVLLFSNWSEDGRMTSTTVRVPFAFGREPEGQESAETLRERVLRGTADRKYPEAEAALEAFAQRFPADPSMTDLHLRLASSLKNDEKFPEAIVVYDQLAHLGAGDRGAYQLACVLKAEHNISIETALDDCDEAVRRDPGSSGALGARGLAYLRLGNYPKAIADFDASLAISARDSYNLMGRGIAKRRSGNAKGGDEDMAAARRLSADVGKAFEGFGFLP